MKDFTLIIPTFNEKENISKIIPLASKEIKKIPKIKFEILVMDDNSPDGTAEQAKKLSKKYPVKVIVRKKDKGLSQAVVEGFKKAEGKVIGVIDADLSHPVEKIPAMLKPLLEGKTDISIGSRYTKGGAIENWPLKRRIISIGATLLARPLTSVKDPVSGYIFMQKEVIKNAELNPTGFKITLEILVKGTYSKVREIPISFKDRAEGESKMDKKQIVLYIKHLLLLYSWKIKSFFR